MPEKLNRAQIESISKFFSDLAKIIFAIAVVGFFVPGSSGDATLPTLIFGSFSTLILFTTSVIILKSEI